MLGEGKLQATFNRTGAVCAVQADRPLYVPAARNDVKVNSRERTDPQQRPFAAALSSRCWNVFGACCFLKPLRSILRARL